MPQDPAHGGGAADPVSSGIPRGPRRPPSPKQIEARKTFGEKWSKIVASIARNPTREPN